MSVWTERQGRLETNPMPLKTRKGFSVKCPHCGGGDDTDSTLRIEIEDLSISCHACDEEVTKEDLSAVICEIGRLLAWLDKAAEV